MKTTLYSKNILLAGIFFIVTLFTLSAACDPEPVAYPANTWSVSVYSDNAFTNYAGYYTQANSSGNGLTYLSTTAWSSSLNPSVTTDVSTSPNTITAFQGCSFANNDNFSFVYKRTFGLAAGVYTCTFKQTSGNGNSLQFLVNDVSVLTSTVASPTVTLYIPANAQLQVKNIAGTGSSFSQVVSISAASAPALSPGTLIADATICYNTQPTNLSVSGASAGCGSMSSKKYQWQSSPDGVTYTDISGATAVQYRPAALTATTYYKRIVTDICLTTAETTPVKITVDTAPATFVAGTIGTTATVFEGTAVSLTNISLASGGYTGSVITYQWLSNESGSYVNISGETNTTYTTPVLTATVSYRRMATATSACGSFSGTSNTVKITVVPPLAAGSLVADKSICYNTSAGNLNSSIASGGCAGTLTYQWKSSIDGISYTNISGATSSAYNPTLTTTTYYKRQVTDLCSNTAETAPVKITVQSAPTSFVAGTIAASTTTICSGSTVSLTNTLSASGGYSDAVITYQWLSNASGSYVAISGATNASYTTSALTSAVSFKRTATSTAACGSFTGNSNTVTITTETALPAPSGISGTFAQCPSNTGVIFTAASVGGAASYVWTLPTGVIAVSGETTRNITVDFDNTYTGGTISCAAVNSCGAGAFVNANLTLGSCDWIWTGAVSTNWFGSGNWSTGVAPNNTSNVVIPNVTNKPIITSGIATINNLIVDVNSSLVIASGGTLRVNGNVTNNGSLGTNSTGKIQTYKTTGLQTFTGDLSGIKYLLKDNASTLQLGNDWNVTGRIDLRAGTIDVDGFALTFDVVNGGYIGYTSGDVGTITGDVTVVKSLSKLTHNIACPLTGVTATQINDDFQVINASNGKSRLFAWDPSTQNWSAPLSGLPLSTTLNRGAGYNFYCTAAGNLDFTGTYTQSASPIVLNGTTGSAGDFLLFGNPYLADLNWESIGKSNVDATVYYWNQSVQAYATYTTGGASSNGGTIRVPVMQGFFVTSVAAGSSSISITPSTILSSTPTATFYRTAAPSDKFNFVVKDNTGKSDEAVIVINEDATPSFDGALDAYKLQNPGTSLNLYTTLGTTDYAVNTIPAAATNQIVALNFVAPASGIYTIESTDINLSTTNVYLKDKVTGTITSIDALPYTFTAEASDAPERFDIMFRTSATASTQNAAASAGINFASFQKDLVVLNQSMQIDNATIVISDLSGNVVKTITGTTISDNTTYNLSELAAGMYMIKLVDQATGDGYSGKISIQ